MKSTEKKLDPVMQQFKKEVRNGLVWTVWFTFVTFMIVSNFGSLLVWVYVFLMFAGVLGVGWRALEYQRGILTEHLGKSLGKPLLVFGEHLINMDGNIRKLNDDNNRMVEYLKRMIMKDTLDVTDPVSLSAYYASVSLLDREHLLVLRDNIKNLRSMSIKRFDQAMVDDSNMFDVYDDLLLRIELRLD